MIDLLAFPSECIAHVFLQINDFDEILKFRTINKKIGAIAEIFLMKIIFPNHNLTNKFTEIIHSEDELIAVIKDLIGKMDGIHNSCFRFSYIQPQSLPAVELSICYSKEETNVKIHQYLISNSMLPSCACLHDVSKDDYPKYKFTYFNSNHIPSYNQAITDLRYDYLEESMGEDFKKENILEQLKDKEKNQAMADYVRKNLPSPYKHILDCEFSICRSDKYWKIMSMLNKIAPSETTSLINNSQKWGHVDRSTKYIYL